MNTNFYISFLTQKVLKYNFNLILYFWSKSYEKRNIFVIAKNVKFYLEELLKGKKNVKNIYFYQGKKLGINYFLFTKKFKTNEKKIKRNEF